MSARSGPQKHDVVVVGTSFASSFFLKRWLEKGPKDASILVLEKGRRDTLKWQVDHLRWSSFEEPTIENRTPEKPWDFAIGFGGTSRAWWACTPRMMPNDFRLRSKYGVGRDWPLGYEELEPYYDEVERIMAVSGTEGTTPFPMRQPYPQPPHLLSDPDELLAAAYPGLYVVQPCARARVNVGERPPCCSNGTCDICPIDSKFTIPNAMAGLYEDPRVTLELGASVETIELAGDVATGVTYLQDGKLLDARADLVVLGANAIFNPHLLLRSGVERPWLGRGLGEQVSRTVTVYLDGVDNYQGSTAITGHGYMLYDGEHRSERAACLIESYNLPSLRAEHGRWRQKMKLKVIFEDLPRLENRVEVSAANPRLAATTFEGISDYARRGLETLPEYLPEVLSPLPVEDLEYGPINPTESHVLGATIMGDDPATSVVDRHLLDHRYRNLLVLGAGTFPTFSPANPTPTLCALSLYAADHLLG